jgi:hypothetical protein
LLKCDWQNKPASRGKNCIHISLLAQAIVLATSTCKHLEKKWLPATESSFSSQHTAGKAFAFIGWSTRVVQQLRVSKDKLVISSMDTESIARAKSMMLLSPSHRLNDVADTANGGGREGKQKFLCFGMMATLLS